MTRDKVAQCWSADLSLPCAVTWLIVTAAALPEALPCCVAISSEIKTFYFGRNFLKMGFLQRGEAIHALKGGEVLHVCSWRQEVNNSKWLPEAPETGPIH